MKTMTFFLLLWTILTSATINAASFSELDIKKDPFSEEITKMLSRSSIIIENDLKVKVIFTITENRKIEIRSISSSHAGVKTFLDARLNGQQLAGNNWSPGRIYELPVMVKAIR